MSLDDFIYREMAFGFQEGDVVRLVSGGPKMTVVGESNQHPGKLWCTWFDDKKQHQGRPFSPGTLKRVDPSEKD